MGMFDKFLKTEGRALENPNFPVSADNFLNLMVWGDYNSSSGVRHFSQLAFGGYAAHTERRRARN